MCVLCSVYMVARICYYSLYNHVAHSVSRRKEKDSQWNYYIDWADAGAEMEYIFCVLFLVSASYLFSYVRQAFMAKKNKSNNKNKTRQSETIYKWIDAVPSSRVHNNNMYLYLAVVFLCTNVNRSSIEHNENQPT